MMPETMEKVLQMTMPTTTGERESCCPICRHRRPFTRACLWIRAIALQQLGRLVLLQQQRWEYL